MAQTSRKYISIFAFCGMLILILDSQTALQGALSGLELCIHTVVPSLFPLTVLSILFSGSMLGRRNSFLSPLRSFCGIPAGAEVLLLTGLIGGYPLGAQGISRAYNSGFISKKDGNRMLAFCSNAGPAFIFGMGAVLFTNPYKPWMLWLIHMSSAVLTGAILPNKSKSIIKMPTKDTPKMTEALNTAIRSMVSICGWVVIFKMLLHFFEKWFLWLLPKNTQILIYGFTEMTNGFVALLKLPSENLRFIFAALFLSFGGVCVCMQTISEIGELDIRSYLLGKSIQSVLSVLLSSVYILFEGSEKYNFPGTLTLVLFPIILLPIILLIYKKTVAFSENSVYNVSERFVAR